MAIDVVLKVIDVSERLLAAHPESGRPGRTKQTRELVIVGLPYVERERDTNSTTGLSAPDLLAYYAKSNPETETDGAHQEYRIDNGAEPNGRAIGQFRSLPERQ